MLVIECPGTIFAKIHRNQMDDEELIAIRNKIDKHQTEKYTTQNGLLCRIENGERLIVVPKLMQDSLIRQIHEYSHLGPEKTEKLLKMDYWFKIARQKIESIMQNCINCILAERKMEKGEGWLHPIPKEECPFDTYYIDHLGPLPSTKKEYHYFFIVIDAFTKLV